MSTAIIEEAPGFHDLLIFLLYSKGNYGSQCEHWDSVTLSVSVFILRQSADWLMLQVPSSHSCPKQLTGLQWLKGDWAQAVNRTLMAKRDWATTSRQDQPEPLLIL